jgi:hypothetical protein
MSKFKLILLAILFSWASSEAFSTPISIEAARVVAKNLYSEAIMLQKLAIPDDVVFNNVIRIGDQQQPLMYVFNLPDNAGFIIVAGDDASYPVLGYALQGEFAAATEGRPEGFNFFMESYERQLSAIRTFQLPQSPENNAGWAHYLMDPFSFDAPTDWVAPLLTTLWDQVWPYNDWIPKDNQGRSIPAGCTATAAAQSCIGSRTYVQPGGQVVNIGGNYCVWDNVMQSSIEAIGSSGKKSLSYDSISFQIGDTIFFDYNNMPDAATEDNHDEIAKLIMCCGAASQMRYCFTGSGAYDIPVRNAMVEKFGFTPNTELVYKANYSEEKWKHMIREELNLHRPVYYSGLDTETNIGHAFVCDGYQQDDYFHINWGWGGQYNGYFYLSDLSPGTRNFAANQAAIVGMMPDGVKCTPPLHLKASAEEDNVVLNWSVPSPKPITEWIHYDTTYQNCWHFNTSPNYRVAIRFDTAQLAAYHGLQLTKIRIIASNNSANLRLNVWKGENASCTILDQEISLKNLNYWVSIFEDTTFNYNTFILEQPIVIDATEDLWIGYTVENQVADKYPVGVDKGPSVPGYGDMICFEGGTWSSASQLYSNWNYNWSIQAFVTDVYGNPYSLKKSASVGQFKNTGAGVITDLGISKSATKEVNQPVNISTGNDPAYLSNSQSTDYVPVLLGYNVFREGAQLNSQPVTELTYTEHGLAPGSYIYHVTAVYDSGVSVLSGPAQAIVGNILNPPLRLAASFTDHDIQLNWTKPLPPLSAEWIHYDRDTCEVGVGFNNGGSFKVAIRFTPEQLAKYEGLHISKAKFYPRGQNTTYQFFIAKGNNASTTITSVPLQGLTINQWNTVHFAQPIPIDVTKELWIGYKVINHPAGQWPAGADLGPGTTGYSDLICTDGINYVPLTSLSAEWDYNWNIQAWVTNQPGEKSLLAAEGPTPNQLKGYNLYCNYAKVNTSIIEDTLWLGEALPSGSYNYYVKALYDEGESGPSNNVTIYLPNIIQENGELAELLIYPNPANSYIILEMAENFDQVFLLDMFGKVVFRNIESADKLKIPTQSLKPGIYILRINSGNRTISTKVAKQ